MKKLSSTKSTLLTGTLFLTLAGILTRIIGFFYRIFLSRTIGAEGLGIYQLIAPVTAICFAFTAAGIQTSISKFVSMEIGKKNGTGAKTYLLLKPSSTKVQKPISRSGLSCPCAFLHSVALFSIIMQISLPSPGWGINGVSLFFLFSPFLLSPAASMPASTATIMG